MPQGDMLTLQTYTRWWDSHLRPRGLPVTDLLAQIHDGVLPMRLLEALEGHEMAPTSRGKAKILGALIATSPKLRVQRIENLSMFLDILIRQRGIALVNIGPEDLEQGKLDLVLGLTFELIKFYELGGHDERSTDGAHAAQRGGGHASGPAAELLSWMRTATAGYPGVSVGASAPSAWSPLCCRSGGARRSCRSRRSCRWRAPPPRH